MPLDARSRDDVRVPAEHRLLGLDKRSFPYALFAVGVFLLATVVIPRIDAAIDLDDPVRAGDRLALAGDLVFTPVVGWEVESGQRAGSEPAGKQGEATVVNDGVTFDIVADSFDGTPAELLDQIEKVTTATGRSHFEAEGDPASVTIPAGDVGVIQSYSSLEGDGRIAAFVIDGTGLQITAYGPPAQMNAAAADIDAMIASISTADRSGA